MIRRHINIAIFVSVPDLVDQFVLLYYENKNDMIGIIPLFTLYVFIQYWIYK